jgi:hypothetical protein
MSRRRNENSYIDRLYGDFNSNPNKNRKALYEEMYVRVLTEICTNRFNWSGLPDEIDTRFLELTLFRYALCVFFHDQEYERYFALRGSGMGQWNMYDNPVRFNVVGNQMISRQLSPGKDVLGNDGTIMYQKCVPIWANTLRVPDWDIVYLQATKLADIERTIEITLQMMRKPYLVAVEDSERLSFLNVLRQVQEGQIAVFGSSMLGQSIDEKIKMFDMKIDRELVLNLQIAKSKIWNETMTLLGINNANQEKRERLVADEVSANDSQIMAVRNSALSQREYACDWIEKVFGIKPVVEWNETAPMGETDSFANYVDPTQTGRMEGMSDGV